jgi:hypothetical protein
VDGEEKEERTMSDIRKALEAAEVSLANLVDMQSTGQDPTIHDYGAARRALTAVRAALAQPQAAQPAPLSDAEVRHIARTTPMGGSNRERDANLIRAGFDVGVSAATPPTEPAPISRTVADTPGMPGCKDITTRYKIAQPAPQAEPAVCPECDGPLQWRCPACRIAQSAAVAEPATAGELPPLPERAEQTKWPSCIAILLALLPKVAGRGWVLDHDSATYPGTSRIRDKDGRCPLSALAHALVPSFVDLEKDTAAWDALGIRSDWHLREMVSQAVDGTSDASSGLRQAIIQAIGVQAERPEVGVLPPLPEPDFHQAVVSFGNFAAYRHGFSADQMRDYARAAMASASPPLQTRMMAWLLECFGPEIAGDKIERNHRFLEEALELVQACGCTADEAHQLVDYTYGRPVGEARQEVGGVVTTLSALCSAQGIDMHDAAEAELARIWTKIDVIRAKQAAKPKHSPLPMAGGES